MKPQPFYTPSSVNKCAYSLKYCWTGWPSKGPFPSILSNVDFDLLDANWESDGLRRLETEWNQDSIRILFSVKPGVSPVFFTSRVKGRLQHALRVSGNRTKFSRKIGFRTIGENSTNEVEAYIRKQVEKERFIDRNFAERLAKFTWSDSNVNFSIPTKTNSGRYWYNLHLVLVNDKRMKLTSEAYLAEMNKWISRIAARKQHLISSRSLMPDHLHLAVRGNLESSPEEIALGYMNNLSYKIGRPIWRPSYYVGSFSEYDINAIRRRF